MNRRRFACLLALIGSAGVAAPSAIAQSTYSFRPLAMIPVNAGARTVSRPIGLSPDGFFSAGDHQGQAAMEKGGSVQSLGFLPSSPFSIATGVAANGDAVTGFTGLEGFYWTPSTGMTGFGVLPGYRYSNGADISERGDTVVGYCWNGSLIGDAEAFLWSPSTGIQPLGFLPGYSSSFGMALSGSGQVVTGHCGGTGIPNTAFRWESGRFQNLGTLPGYTSSVGLGISRFGDYIVGYASVPSSISEAFIWNKSSGMKGIGTIPGFSHSYLRDISENGNRSVGFGSFNGTGVAFLYENPSGKIILLKDLLLSKGITGVRGWELQEASSISDDGTVIVGIGLNPRGRKMYWQVTLP